MEFIPWIISAFMLVFAILTYYRNGQNDKRSEAEKDSIIMNGIKESLLKANMKLDQVCSTTTETRADIKSMNKDLQNLDTRLTVVERDVKTAFTMIEDIKKGC